MSKRELTPAVKDHDDIVEYAQEKKDPVITPYSDTFIEHALSDEEHPFNYDPDYWFKLRDDTQDNLFVDCATPLIGLILRARGQRKPHEDLNGLYQQCVDEINSIEFELYEAGFDHATIIAYRYVLCTFIDEAIMSTEWGAGSAWMSKSLLVHFHNEAWGGEKTYLIIKKLEQDLAKYFSLLEFMFLCLCLGFQGRFKVMDFHAQKKHEEIVLNLYDKLKRYKRWEPEPLVHPYENIVPKDYALKKEMTPMKIVVSIFLFSIAVYLVYLFILNGKGNELVEELHKVLVF